ncbi:hypothetical protein EC991_002080 [Linnemannia zychae]|nr:hypothetical protein EC991_002080 [Linnemannia zychae]
MLEDRMDKVEEERRIVLELMTPPQTMIESYQPQCRKDFITEAERKVLLSLCQSIRLEDIDEGEEVGDNEKNDNPDIENRQEEPLGSIDGRVETSVGHGARDLYNKPEIMQEEGIVRHVANVQIRDVSVVENFLYFNKLAGNNIAPQGLTGRQWREAVHLAAIKLLSLDQIRSHLDVVTNEWLDPHSNSVSFKIYLQKNRIILTTKEDVGRLWPGVQPEEIKTLTLYGGQACVFDVFTDIPEGSQASGKGKEVNRTPSAMGGIIVNSVEPTTFSTSSTSSTHDQQ